MAVEPAANEGQIEEFDQELSRHNLMGHWRGVPRQRNVQKNEAQLWKWDTIYPNLIRAGELIEMDYTGRRGRCSYARRASIAPAQTFRCRFSSFSPVSLPPLIATPSPRPGSSSRVRSVYDGRWGAALPLSGRLRDYAGLVVARPHQPVGAEHHLARRSRQSVREREAWRPVRRAVSRAHAADHATRGLLARSYELGSTSEALDARGSPGGGLPLDRGPSGPGAGGRGRTRPVRRNHDGLCEPGDRGASPPHLGCTDPNAGTQHADATASPYVLHDLSRIRRRGRHGSRRQAIRVEQGRLLYGPQLGVAHARAAWQWAGDPVLGARSAGASRRSTSTGRRSRRPDRDRHGGTAPKSAADRDLRFLYLDHFNVPW